MRSTNRTPNRWRAPRICALNCALALASAGCMTSPQNNQQLQSTDEDVTFNGFVPSKESVVQVSAKHDNGGYDPIILGAPVSPEEHVDAANQTWFSWSAVSEIPRSTNYWRQVPGQRRLSATVKSEIWPGWSEWAQAFPSTPLASFDVGFGDCLNQNAPYGGGAIIANCHSAQSPEVTVTAPCGKYGYTCCEDTPCDGSMFCYPRTNVCALCGSENSQCCSEEICAGGLQCQADNYCRPGGVTWSLGIQDLKTLDVSDDNGDEPYFMVVGFRTTPDSRGSTQVFWNKDIGVFQSAVPAGYTIAIPANQGRLTFPNVRTTRASNIGSQKPEIIGFFVVAMENDGSDTELFESGMHSRLDTVKQLLIDTIESRTLGDIVTNGVNIDEQTVMSRFESNIFQTILTWGLSGGDPDDRIGFHAVAYVAIDDSIPLPPSNSSLITLERLLPMGTGLPGNPDDITLTGNGASYSVNRFARKQ